MRRVILNYVLKVAEHLFYLFIIFLVKILLIGALLIIFGIFSIYSVSIFESFWLTLNLVQSWAMTDPSNYYYFREQMMKLWMGLVLSLFVRLAPLKLLKKRKRMIFLLTLVWVFLLFVPWLSLQLNGSNAWLKVPGGTIQPWEFYKIGFVVYLAYRLLRKHKKLPELSFFLWFLVQVGLLTIVFLFIPDLWTLLVLGSVALVMFWYAGGKVKYIGIMMWLWLIFGALAATQFSYIQKRLDYFLNPTTDASDRGIWRQTRQALIAVGGGWRVGKWYGKWLQKFWYIPEAQSDFIFAAFSEEIGFLGDAVLLLLYCLLAYYFLQQLPKVKDEYYKIVGVGFLAMIMMQVFINIWVNIKLLPLTWLTLPFISHGGSALIVNMIELVWLQKIVLEK